MSRSNVWDLEDALNDENFDPLWNIVEILKAALPIDDMSLEEEECDYPAALEVRTHRCRTAFITPDTIHITDNS